MKPGLTVSFKGDRAKNPESMNVSGRLTWMVNRCLRSQKAIDSAAQQPRPCKSEWQSYSSGP